VSYDFSTIGETMIRINPVNNQRIEQASYFNVSIGGSESNTGILLSRLGLKTCWCSKLPINQLGKKIASEIKRNGVDLNFLVWSKTGRVGVYFVEAGVGIRPTNIIYDRKNSCINDLSIEDINIESFLDTKLFHLTGITPALSKNCYDLSVNLIKEAKKRKVQISFDINYRSTLWTEVEAKRSLHILLPYVDILFCRNEDVQIFYEYKSEEPHKVATKLQKEFMIPVVVITNGEHGSTAKINSEYYTIPGIETDVIENIGAGDAFSAGFLYNYLQNKNGKECLEFANKMAALKLTIPGDIGYISNEDISLFKNYGKKGNILR
jgi:2-dehydro-3-deoxygluconokinase